jgi:hypothetical protein
MARKTSRPKPYLNRRELKNPGLPVLSDIQFSFSHPGITVVRDKLLQTREVLTASRLDNLVTLTANRYLAGDLQGLLVHDPHLRLV